LNGNVYYKNDPAWKLEITAKESIHGMIETKVVDKKLVIQYNNGKTYDEDESIAINISGPAVNRFELNTSGSIYCMNDIQLADLYLRSSGSGNIYLHNVFTNSIEAESIVSGRISVMGGTAINGKIKTDGSGKIDMTTLALRTATARLIGSGDIKLKVAEQLNARIDGSGSIYFSGYPLVISEISGTGRLIHY
ncbi:MAG: DUF2807 domain-containing protein, partial [Bacteroidota bacterium]